MWTVGKRIRCQIWKTTSASCSSTASRWRESKRWNTWNIYTLIYALFLADSTYTLIYALLADSTYSIPLYIHSWLIVFISLYIHSWLEIQTHIFSLCLCLSLSPNCISTLIYTLLTNSGFPASLPWLRSSGTNCVRDSKWEESSKGHSTGWFSLKSRIWWRI